MKETLVLLHGALGSKKQFTALLDALEASFTIHTLNFEGHGGKASPKEFSIQLFTDNVIDYIKENSIKETTIFGYSMGGYVALNTALQIPNRIKKIKTLGTKFHWDSESARKEVLMLNPDKIEEKVPHFAEKLRQEHHPQDWKKIMTKTATMMLNMAKGARLTDADFKRIKQQVTIGIGSLDKMVTYEESAYITKLLPNSKLIMLEGVPHPIDQIKTDTLLQFIISN